MTRHHDTYNIKESNTLEKSENLSSAFLANLFMNTIAIPHRSPMKYLTQGKNRQVASIFLEANFEYTK